MCQQYLAVRTRSGLPYIAGVGARCKGMCCPQHNWLGACVTAEFHRHIQGHMNGGDMNGSNKQPGLGSRPVTSSALTRPRVSRAR
jgi:hypothetical protein